MLVRIKRSKRCWFVFFKGPGPLFGSGLFFLIFLLPGLVLADSIDEDIAAANAHLDENRAKSPELAIKLLKADLQKCFRGQAGAAENRAPDKQGQISKWIGNPKIKSFYDFVHHGGEGITASANHGILNWMRDSVISDPRLYQAAKVFLKKLQEKDIEAGLIGKNKDLVPIQERASFDVFELARQAIKMSFGAEESTYLTLKLLALYGHDNINNALGGKVEEGPRRCEYVILDMYRPAPTSTLYRNEAIKGLSYSESDVKEGVQIAQECLAACGALPISEYAFCSDVCNDWHENYQADYYHVITASYLVCLAERNAAYGPGLLESNSSTIEKAYAAANKLFDERYPEAGKTYKFIRFVETAFSSRKSYDRHADDHLLGDPFSLASESSVWRRIIRHAVSTRLASTDAGKICAELKLKCGSGDVRAAQAIINRFKFEIGFRERQHAMGQRFARDRCSVAPAWPICR